MNRARTSARSRTRTGGGFERGNRSADSGRFSKAGRSGGQGRRTSSQGEFALPVTHTPALPAVEAVAELDIPQQLLAALRAEGVSVPFPIHAATRPNPLAGRDVLGRRRTGSGKPLA